MRKIDLERQRRQRIREALGHYRCPHCGSPADFIERELSVTNYAYDIKKERWVVDGHESAEDNAIEAEEVLEESYEVKCGSCDSAIRWADGSVVKAALCDYGSFQDWLNALADQWENQKKELEKLSAELEKAKQDFNPPGFYGDLENRVKKTETITTVARANITTTTDDQ